MNRIVLNCKVGRDGLVHIDVPVGVEEADQPVQVTVEPQPNPDFKAGKKLLTADELLRSGLVGIWADRTDIGDSREFSRRLREEAQTRRQHT